MHQSYSNEQLNESFLIVAGIAIMAGIVFFVVNIFPWWYVDKKGSEAGLDEFTISQWRWKALWLGFLVLIPFKRCIEQKEREKKVRESKGTSQAPLTANR